MHQSGTAERGEAAVDSSDPLDSRRLVVGVGLLMVIAHTAYRGWVAYQGYFFADDYSLLAQARATGLTGDYLVDPAGHLTPGGRLIIWVVAHHGTLNWPLAATFAVALELVVALAALAMFLTLFGARWLALAPLALYLTTALTLPAFTWWISALLLMPTQFAFFASVTAWVLYLRSGRARWALAAYASIAFALLFDVKGLVVVPVLAYLALGYFAEGSLWRRVLDLLRRYWPAVAMAAPALAAYLWYFLSGGDEPVASPGWTLTGQLLRTTLGETFPAAVLGGPWHWDYGVQPTSLATPPAWGLHVAWVVLAGVVAYGWLRRTRTLRAWGVIALVLTIDVGLLLVTRAGSFGASVGREYRFFAEVAPAVALALGLAFMALPGARECSHEREPPLLALRVGTAPVIAFVAVVSALGLVSQTLYARQWHSGNQSEAYVRLLRSELKTHGAVDLVDNVLPEAVVQFLVTPYNRVQVLVSLISDTPSFPDMSPQLVAVADDGSLRHAKMAPGGVTSTPGPQDQCGWPVRSGGEDIPLTGGLYDSVWWVRIGYLSSEAAAVTVSAGESSVSGPVTEGLGELWVRVEGSFDTVHIDGIAGDATMCVDTIEVGQPVPGDYL